MSLIALCLKRLMPKFPLKLEANFALDENMRFVDYSRIMNRFLKDYLLLLAICQREIFLFKAEGHECSHMHFTTKNFSGLSHTLLPKRDSQ